MERIPHRELRNNSAEILRRVADGESFEITNHGTVVALLRPPHADDLWASEIATKASSTQPWADLPCEPSTSGSSTEQVLDRLREERS